MRTTLTLDDDVTAQLKRLLRERDASLKDVVNDALRLGLREMQTPTRPRKPFRTKTYDMGEPLVPLDSIAETLALIEGENFK